MKFNFDNRNKLYSKIFVFLVGCVVFVIFITSTILYFNFESIAQNIAYDGTMRSLEQESNDVSVMANTATTLINQMFRDLTISRLMYYNKPDVYELQAARSQLQSYSQVMQFIDSIYIYNGNLNIMYIGSNESRNSIQSLDSFDDQDVLPIIENYQDYKPFSPIPRSFNLNNSDEKKKNYYTFLGYNWLDSGDALRCAIVVNISQEWINTIVASAKNDSFTSSFIIDRDGKVISNTKNFTMMKDLSNTEYIKKILNSEENGYFLSYVNGENSFIAYTSPDNLGWRYIRIIPYGYITKDIRKMRINTIIFSLGILLVGLFFSFVISKILYKPIRKIEFDLDLLQKEMRNSTFTLKQDFLKKIVLGNTELKNENMEANFIKYNLSIASRGSYLLIMLKIDNYSNFTEKNSPSDRSLLKYAVINIANELCSKSYNAETVDMNNDCMVIILNKANNGAFYSKYDFENLSKQLQDIILKHFDLSLTVVKSRIGDNIKEISTLYNQGIIASHHRLFLGYKSIIYTDEILTYDSKEYLYPIKKEKMLQDMLMKGKTDEAKKIYLEIINESAKFPYSVINIIISRLALTLNVSINTIQKNNSINSDLTNNLLFIQINGTELIEEINQKFFSFIDNISTLVEEKKSSKYEILVDKINDIINSKYMDATLGIDNIADTLMMSSTYIGRIFKQNTLKTIHETIIERRMLEARRLLSETTLPILSISEMTGFSSDSYFYKTFKKKNGITPADYRKNFLAI